MKELKKFFKIGFGDRQSRSVALFTFNRTYIFSKNMMGIKTKHGLVDEH